MEVGFSATKGKRKGVKVHLTDIHAGLRQPERREREAELQDDEDVRHVKRATVEMGKKQERLMEVSCAAERGNIGASWGHFVVKRGKREGSKAKGLAS